MANQEKQEMKRVLSPTAARELTAKEMEYVSGEYTQTPYAPSTPHKNNPMATSESARSKSDVGALAGTAPPKLVDGKFWPARPCYNTDESFKAVSSEEI